MYFTHEIDCLNDTIREIRSNSALHILFTDSLIGRRTGTNSIDGCYQERLTRLGQENNTSPSFAPQIYGAVTSPELNLIQYYPI
jgi:hypothetical protein